MLEKTYTYANQIHYVKEFRVDQENEKFRIVTNLSTYERKFESIHDFLDYWKPVNSTTLPTTQLQAETNENDLPSITFQQENNLSNNLIAILNDSIAKVQNSKEYIPQAQCINNNIYTIVNIAKMRMSVYKQFKPGLNRQRG